MLHGLCGCRLTLACVSLYSTATPAAPTPKEIKSQEKKAAKKKLNKDWWGSSLENNLFDSMFM
jgi:hypothetical protein